ncbi:MAG: XRE family transcriptional regulator [Actinobacteria bacterium ATB1]|nr:XRE family transcriptional regulator [Actinobacteria bacterium ATB1]
MITNETQYRATAAHLGQFEEALANLEATAAQAPDAKLRTLEIDAIKARIARGWTQRDLAERLGVAEQQIQRYESTQYTSASLARLSDIAKALDIDVRETVSLRKPGAA